MENIATRLLHDMKDFGRIDEFFITKNDKIFGDEVMIKGKTKGGKEYDLHLTVTEAKKEDKGC